MYNNILFLFLPIWRHDFVAFPICTTSRLLFLVVRKELSAHTHTHSRTDVYTLHHHTYRLHCEPWLSSADNKSEEWPLAASLCLTLSLCKPSSLALLIYTCFCSLPLFPSCSAQFIIVDFFVCSLFFANLFSCLSVSSLFFFLSSLLSVFLFLSFLFISGCLPLFSFTILYPSWLVSLFTIESSCCPSLPFISRSLLQDPLLAVCLPLQLH